jgi:hypothetical protein
MARSRLGEEHSLAVRFESRQLYQETPRSPRPTASCPPQDRDYELTVLFFHNGLQFAKHISLLENELASSLLLSLSQFS